MSETKPINLTIDFDPNNQEHKTQILEILHAPNYKYAIAEIAKLFRAARKHGYGEEYENSEYLNDLIKIPEVTDAISHLESEFFHILNSLNANPNQD